MGLRPFLGFREPFFGSLRPAASRCPFPGMGARLLYSPPPFPQGLPCVHMLLEANTQIPLRPHDLQILVLVLVLARGCWCVCGSGPELQEVLPELSHHHEVCPRLRGCLDHLPLLLPERMLEGYERDTQRINQEGARTLPYPKLLFCRQTPGASSAEPETTNMEPKHEGQEMKQTAQQHAPHFETIKVSHRNPEKWP